MQGKEVGREEREKDYKRRWLSFDVAQWKQSLPKLHAHTASCCRESYPSRWSWSETMKPSAEMFFSHQVCRQTAAANLC